MSQSIWITVFLLVGSLRILMSQNLSDEKKEILSFLDQQTNTLSSAAQQIWTYAELGFQEEKSSRLLKEMLKDAGFSIKSGVAEMPTAFVASYGEGKPVIGILAEFDALPGVSQEAVPYRKERQD